MTPEQRARLKAACPTCVIDLEAPQRDWQAENAEAIKAATAKLDEILDQLTQAQNSPLYVRRQAKG